MSTVTKVSPPPHTAPDKRSGRGLLVFAVLAAIAVGAGWYYYTHVAKTGAAAEGAEANAEGATSVGEAIPVETVRLSKGGIVRTSTQIGSVHPYFGAELYAKVSGYLMKLNVDYGDRVKKDQLLAVIDDPEIVEDEVKAAADVDQAKAAVEQAVAFIEAAKADRDATDSSVQQAIAEVDRYTSMKTLHQKKFARYKELVANRALPQEIADEEQEGYESAKANELASQKAVLKTKADLIAANARVKKAEADLVAAKANLEVSKAKLARAKVFVEYTKILSPYNGVITKRNFFRGDFIRSAAEGGTVPVLTVAETDRVRVATYIPDRDVPMADVGDPAEITLDALPGEVFKGKISRFAESEDPTSRTMYTEVDLENKDNRLREGMYGIAKLILDTETKNSTLPSGCLVGEAKGGKADIFIIKSEKARKVQVEIGADDGLRVEILSGITPEDDVILNTGSVTDGAPVKGTPHVTTTTKATGA